MASNTDAFDAAISTVTQERGKDYGAPLQDFERVSEMALHLTSCPDPAIYHSMYMICVKLSRLVHSPHHLDSIIDIAGYARTMAMIIDEREEQ
jgi:hypothetical protein